MFEMCLEVKDVKLINMGAEMAFWTPKYPLLGAYLGPK